MYFPRIILNIFKFICLIDTQVSVGGEAKLPMVVFCVKSFLVFRTVLLAVIMKEIHTSPRYLVGHFNSLCNRAHVIIRGGVL